MHLTVDGREPGSEITADSGVVLGFLIAWESHYPLKRVELVYNGTVIAEKIFDHGSTGGQLEADIPVTSDGWVAARAGSDTRDSFAQPIFAHTSPVYLRSGVNGPEKKAAARWFDGEIDRSLEWVNTRGRFYNDTQRREVVDLFREGQAVYRGMIT